MDIVLEGNIDGIEAAEKIEPNLTHQLFISPPIPDKITVERAKTTHPSAFILKEPFGFLHKPFEENELYTAIDILLSRRYEEKILKDYDNLILSFIEISKRLCNSYRF